MLKKVGATLYWECETAEMPREVNAAPLRYLIVYPEAFPAVPPNIEIVSPDLDPSEWGHEWHRWPSGNICYIRPSKWQVGTTADEIIRKIDDWYFNYTAKKGGLIAEMPEMGRAKFHSQESHTVIDAK